MWRSFWADGSAMLTIDASRMIISCATAMTPSASQRLGSSASGDVPDPVVDVLSDMGSPADGLEFQGKSGTFRSVVPDEDRIRWFVRVNCTPAGVSPSCPTVGA